MGKKEKNLKSLLSKVGETGVVSFPRLTLEHITRSSISGEVERTYRLLGGTLNSYPVNARATWDLDFDGVAVELDEQLHFNRLRALTLRNPVYAKLPRFPLIQYQTYCVDHEQECLKAGRHGGKWSNASCERQFGVSSPRGELGGNGPARWKQRAFYDFLKDLTPLLLGFPVVRVSIWDEITIHGRPTTVGKALDEDLVDAAGAIAEIIQRRKTQLGDEAP